MTEPAITFWIFNGERSPLPSGVFSDLDQAEAWIAHQRLSGILSQYPVGTGVYEWAISQDHFTPERDDQKTPEFIAKFSCASLEHFHYLNGKQD